MSSSEPARPPTEREMAAGRRKRRREGLEAASEVAWAVLSWVAVVGSIAVVALIVVTIFLCAGVG